MTREKPGRRTGRRPGPVAGGPGDVATTRTRDRFSGRRWRGRLGRWRALLGVITLVALAGGSGWLVLGSDALDVDAVAVEGTRLLSPAEVKRAAAVSPQAPLARVDLDAVTARVERLVQVESADVTRDWPDTVRVVVTERHAVAVVEEAGRYRGLDAEGVLFRSYRAAPAALPLVRSDDLASASSESQSDSRSDSPSGSGSPGSGSPGSGSPGGGDAAAESRHDALREVALVVESLPASVARKVDHVELASLDSIALALSDGSTVRWGSADDSRLKAEVLTALMSVPASTYDVSVPGLPTTSG